MTRMGPSAGCCNEMVVEIHVAMMDISKMNHLCAVVLLASIGAVSAADLSALDLSIQPAQTHRGQSATINWSGISFDAVLIPGFGILERSGKLTVDPVRTTTYVIIGIKDGRMTAHAGKVQVDGERGDDQTVTFPFQLSRTAPSAQLIDLLRNIPNVLRGIGLVPLDPRVTLTGTVVFATQPRISNDLVNSDQKQHVLSRQVSYGVEFANSLATPKALECTVHTLIETRKTGESDFHRDKPKNLSMLYQLTTERMLDLILKGSKP